LCGKDGTRLYELAVDTHRHTKSLGNSVRLPQGGNKHGHLVPIPISQRHLEHALAATGLSPIRTTNRSTMTAKTPARTAAGDHR